MQKGWLQENLSPCAVLIILVSDRSRFFLVWTTYNLIFVEASFMMNQDWFKGVFDDNKGDDKKLKGQEHFMITKMMISKNQRMSSTCSRLNQEQFKVQEEIWFQESRIKIQGSSFQESRSRFKIQESREELIKISMKKFFENWVAHGFFSKHVYQRVFTLR